MQYAPAHSPHQRSSMCATVTQEEMKRLWRAARRTLFRCSTGRAHGETDKEQSRPSRVGHRRWKLLKLGEGSWFAIPYRTILEAPRDLRCSSRSPFETGSDKRWEMRMKVPPTHGYRTMRLKLKLQNFIVCTYIHPHTIPL